MTPDGLIASAQRYGDELGSPRIISGFAARALPLGSVLVRAHNGQPAPDVHAVVKVLGGWWAFDGQSPEPLAGDIEFVVLHVPQPEQARPVIPSRPSWRPRTFFTGPARKTFADGGA